MKALIIGSAVAVLLAGCATDPASKYASLDNLSDTEQNQALKECFKKENKYERHECIAAYAPPEIGFRCERVQVTGTRFGERVCTTQRQRDEVQTASQETFSEFQRRNKFVKDQADL